MSPQAFNSSSFPGRSLRAQLALHIDTFSFKFWVNAIIFVSHLTVKLTNNESNNANHDFFLNQPGGRGQIVSRACPHLSSPLHSSGSLSLNLDGS